MSALIHMDFFRNALIAGVLLGILYGMISFFVVHRRIAFLGAGIAHTAFGGVAVGVVLGISPFFSALVFCILAAWLIGRIVRKTRLTADSGIGIFFAFSMALGALLLSLRQSYSFDLTGYLFGNILSIGSQDLIAVTAVALFTVVFFGVFLHRLLFMTFDEELARVSGIRVSLLEDVLLILLAALIVVSIRLVGIILVSALTVLPAAFSGILFKRYRAVFWGSVVYAVTIVTGGLFLSYYANLPTGATIVITGTLLYLIVSLGSGRGLLR